MRTFALLRLCFLYFIIFVPRSSIRGNQNEERPETRQPSVDSFIEHCIGKNYKEKRNKKEQKEF